MWSLLWSRGRWTRHYWVRRWVEVREQQSSRFKPGTSARSTGGGPNRQSRSPSGRKNKVERRHISHARWAQNGRRIYRGLKCLFAAFVAASVSSVVSQHVYWSISEFVDSLVLSGLGFYSASVVHIYVLVSLWLFALCLHCRIWRYRIGIALSSW